MAQPVFLESTQKKERTMLISVETRLKEEHKTEALLHLACGAKEFSSASFRRGIDFAEGELKNLAIEFAEWVVSESFEQHNDGSWSQNWEDGHDVHNSTALFEKFIEQRNKP